MSRKSKASLTKRQIGLIYASARRNIKRQATGYIGLGRDAIRARNGGIRVVEFSAKLGYSHRQIYNHIRVAEAIDRGVIAEAYAVKVGSTKSFILADAAFRGIAIRAALRAAPTLTDRRLRELLYGVKPRRVGIYVVELETDERGMIEGVLHSIVNNPTIDASTPGEALAFVCRNYNAARFGRRNSSSSASNFVTA